MFPACQAFEKRGIRGFDADYFFDYTCMETLQGLSVSELSSAEGRKWRTAYSDPANTEKVGLMTPSGRPQFKNFEQFIRDTGLNAADLTLNYDDIMDRMRSGELAMFFGSSANVKILQDEGIDTTFLPFFGQDGQQWLMTTLYFSGCSEPRAGTGQHPPRQGDAGAPCHASPRKHRTASSMTDRTF